MNKYRQKLLEAREGILSEEHQFLCVAVGTGTEEGSEICNYIQKLLGSCFTLDKWVGFSLGFTQKDYIKFLDLPERKDKMRITRLAWIDWMLENEEMFKEKAYESE